MILVNGKCRSLNIFFVFLKFNFIKFNSQNKGNTLPYIYWKLLLNHENNQQKPETHGRGKKKDSL